MADISHHRLAIRLVKRRGKLPLLICTRADGSSTIGEISVGPEHDLAHFVVETTLGLRRAFYGLVAEGMNIEDFNVPGGAQRLQLPEEAVRAEFIVGLVQAERRCDRPFADFNDELKKAIGGARHPLPPPAISDAQLAIIRKGLEDLLQKWSALPPDGAIELAFH
ncbi:hypothetical protein B7486_09055 [cyanobacterium TDX16]|nr:hypothetical protein B7486_09055 [cyanobacterium TDX16]